MKIKMKHIAIGAVGVAITYHVVRSIKSKRQIKYTEPKSPTLEKKPQYNGWENRSYNRIK